MILCNTVVYNSLAQLAQAESFQESLQVPLTEQDLVYRLRKRAEIRRQIPGRRSVEQGKPDRIADLLEEAAAEIERLTALENK